MATLDELVENVAKKSNHRERLRNAGFTEVVTCDCSPMVVGERGAACAMNHFKTAMTLYKVDDGRHFFYMISDPGLYSCDQWYRCSPGRLVLEKDKKLLHFHTQNGSHYAFEIGDADGFSKLTEYVSSLPDELGEVQ